MKRILSFLGMSLLLCIMPLFFSACGGGGDEVVSKVPTPTKPNNTDSDNKPNDNSSATNNTPTNNDPVQQTCPLCLGSRTCKTCNGTGKGCKTCGGSGLYCTECGGSGECDCNDGNCSKCYGTGKEICDYCRGSAKCFICKGLGWTVKSEYKCSACGGTGNCTNRKCVKGYVDCYKCDGTGNCNKCDGSGLCKKCKGNPYCKTCGGDGHCPTCLNSDGKCTQCHGDGYVLVDLILNPTALEFTNYGGEKDVSITINGAWKATCNESWIKLTKAEGNGKGSFHVEAEVNSSGTSRTAIVTISFGIGKTASYHVTQAATIFSQSIASSKFTYEGGKTTLSVKASETISWTLTRSESWVHLGKSSNYQESYSGKGNADVEIYVDINTITEARSAVLTLKSDFGTKEISITQNAMEDKVEAKMTTTTIKADGESKLLSIVSPTNREWKVSCKEKWVHFDVESGSGMKNVNVTIDKNEDYYPRTCDITVTSTGVPAQTIKITQEGQKMYMTLKQSLQSFTYSASTFTVSVTTIPANLKWTATRSDSWIHLDTKSNYLSQYKHDGTYTLYVYVDENTTLSSRSGSITFTSEAGTETINFTQGGRSAPVATTELGKMLNYPFGTVNLDMTNATYYQIRSALVSSYRLDSESGYFFLYGEDNPGLRNYSYRRIPFYRLYVSDNTKDVEICYTFRISSSNISDPGAVFDQIVKDFNDIGIPLKVSQYSSSWGGGSYETAYARYTAEIKYSSYPSSGWEYSIEVFYKK